MRTPGIADFLILRETEPSTVGLILMASFDSSLFLGIRVVKLDGAGPYDRVIGFL